ncbi:hypothetical protein B0O99DRAFT_217822 [Bisporella sp. PMI_857]|nr:hypothetical protein B0O99DRAFT_217822 [Bisporella sp. PMI_857]
MGMVVTTDCSPTSAQKVQKVPTPEEKRPCPANFCEDLVSNAKLATVMQPLSKVTTSFLTGYMDPYRDPTETILAVPKRMILGCEKLWEGPARGVVLKRTGNVAVKIVRGISS